MSGASSFFRQIPKVDELLAHPAIEAAARETSRQEALNEVRAAPAAKGGRP
jgi:hypothetical protein